MTAIASKKLGETVGAEVLDVDRERVLGDDTLLSACLDLLEAHCVLVFHGLHLHDAAQVMFWGRALLDDLLAKSTAPDRTYRYQWSVGDTVIWDNRGVLHPAHPYDPSSARDMHGTTLVGDEPIEAAMAESRD